MWNMWAYPASLMGTSLNRTSVTISDNISDTIVGCFKGLLLAKRSTYLSPSHACDTSLGFVKGAKKRKHEKQKYKKAKWHQNFWWQQCITQLWLKEVVLKFFFTILVLHIFYFLQSEYIKKLQNRKAKNLLTYLPICSILKKIMTTSLLLIHVRIT